ncbi:THUMP domain-containing protein 1 [Cladochytrium tenue]|nr:THUMP domain-containing protein 1 [Cladochytrium tenue]
MAPFLTTHDWTLQYADKIYGEQRGTTSDAEDGDGIEAGLAKELESLRQAEPEARRFVWLDVGLDCIVFIKTGPGIDPVELVMHIMRDLDESKKKKTRQVTRLVPVQESTSAHTENVVAMARRVLPSQFSSNKPVKYAIVFNRRCNDQVDREVVISKLADCIGAPHTVDLKAPDRVILVEVLKSICGISVVDDYHRYHKLNLEAVYDLEFVQSQNKRRSAPADSSKNEGPTKRKKGDPLQDVSHGIEVDDVNKVEVGAGNGKAED